MDSIIDCKTQFLISKFISITLSIKFELGNRLTDTPTVPQFQGGVIVESFLEDAHYNLIIQIVAASLQNCSFSQSLLQVCQILSFNLDVVVSLVM